MVIVAIDKTFKKNRITFYPISFGKYTRGRKFISVGECSSPVSALADMLSARAFGERTHPLGCISAPL